MQTSILCQTEEVRYETSLFVFHTPENWNVQNKYIKSPCNKYKGFYFWLKYTEITKTIIYTAGMNRINAVFSTLFRIIQI